MTSSSPPKWNAANIKKLRLLLADDKLRLVDIARKFGVSDAAIRHRMKALTAAGEPGFEARGKKIVWTPEQIDRVRIGYASGERAADIALDVSKNRDQVVKIAMANGWRHPKATKRQQAAVTPEMVSTGQGLALAPFMPTRPKGCVWPSIDSGGVKYCGRGRQGHAHWCDHHRSIALQPAREMEEV